MTDNQLPEGSENPSAIGSHEYLIVNDLGDRVTFQSYQPETMLPASDLRGYESEERLIDIAREWGFPENVFLPTVVSKGNATREIGDLVLVSGRELLVVQVKSRNSGGDDPFAARRWIHRNVAKAAKQGRGSVRSLRQGPELFVNGRGSLLNLGGTSINANVLVVLDIERVPEGIYLTENHDFAVMTAVEYEFLFRQLKSVGAVIRYVGRTINTGQIEFGTEIQRYMSLANADLAVSLSNPSPHRKPASQPHLSSYPMLPIEPAGVIDSEAYFFFRKVFEFIGEYAIEIKVDNQVTRRIFGCIDSLPVQSREMLGRYLLDQIEWLERPNRRESGGEWRFRLVLMDDAGTRFFFATTDHFDSKRTLDMFHSRLQVAHHELQIEHPNVEDKTTIGLLLTPRDGANPFDISLLAVGDDQRLSDADYHAIRDFWTSQRPGPSGKTG